MFIPAGEVKTSTTNMNYEDMSSAGGAGTTFTLTIYATDSRGATASQNLVINVIDINETPSFSKNEYGCHGNENTVNIYLLCLYQFFFNFVNGSTTG